MQVVIKVKPALSEGSLLCILWIITGSWNGAFLFSAVDGHYDTNLNEPDGPTSAALLGLSTFIGTANLRILFALGTAVLEHREVGVTKGEELIPLEIAFGSMLMSAHGECCTPVSKLHKNLSYNVESMRAYPNATQSVLFILRTTNKGFIMYIISNSNIQAHYVLT